MWASAGHEIAFGQYVYQVKEDVPDGKSDSAETAITAEKDVCVSDAFVKKPQIIRSTHNIGVRGEHFEVMFSVLNGGLVSYKYAGKEMIEQSRNQTSGAHQQTMTVEILCRCATHSGKSPVCI